jgi:branched-chain amino acid transport system permease protein
MTALIDRVNRLTRGNAVRIPAVLAVVFALLLPFFIDDSGKFIGVTTRGLALVVMALGLNIVVGYAGLLDLGYVAFYAFGSYSVGWFGSTFFAKLHIHIFSAGQVASQPGLHMNFLLVMLAAVIICATVGILIGLPTLRLRGDYIAIVTLGFGEIIRVFAINGDSLKIRGQALTAGNLGITPIDPVNLPLINQFSSLNLDLKPWYFTGLALVFIALFINVRVRDSRLGRAWIAIREDEVAAASMGVPLVKTKLQAYATGGAFGGVAGVFLGSFLGTITASQFEFSFSIFILAMIILGGLGSVWGVVVGSLALTYINYYLIPGAFRALPHTFGLKFDLTDLSFGIFGFLLVLMMLLRPEGLLPERRRKIELTEGVGSDETVYEVQA